MGGLMSSIVVSGDTSGAITIAAPAVAGTNTLTLPAVTGTVVVSGQNSALTLATPQTSTSGTNIDFTGIPSWVRRVTVMFQGVSTSGVNDVLVQLGTASGVETSGYVGVVTRSGSSANVLTNLSAGFNMDGNTGSSAAIRSGSLILTLMSTSTNTWAGQACIGLSNVPQGVYCGGYKPLVATLTSVRITTIGGTDTFDAGSINILYE